MLMPRWRSENDFREIAMVQDPLLAYHHGILQRLLPLPYKYGDFFGERVDAP